MEDKKEMAVEGSVLAEDPAVKLVEEYTTMEDKGETLMEKEGKTLPPEVIESGIGVGYVTGFKNGASAGIAGEEDFRSDTTASRSQDK